MELGRPFVGRSFDLLVIGGGLSLAVVAWLAVSPTAPGWLLADGRIWIVVLLCNSAHFAASTVRLYSKPGAFREMPFLTMGLPLATLAVLTLAATYPGALGRHFEALYFTWSPYHYAAQAYGLALMYCYRSGSVIDVYWKRWLRLACVAPFLFAFVNSRGAGLEWFVPAGVLANPLLNQARGMLLAAFGLASFLMPVLLFLRFQFAAERPMPVISFVVMIANGVWWIALTYVDAFVWATVFHSIQYLAIATIFQVKDEQRRAPGLPWWRPAARYYALCLGLGYLLFQVWPHAFVAAGFGYAQSLLLVVAAINIHHFVVDAYIWRLRKEPAVTAGTAAVAG